MRQRTFSGSRKSRSAGALILEIIGLLSCQSCGLQRTMTFPSPSGKMAIEVLQARFENSMGMRVDLVTPEHRTALFIQRRETLVYFVHVYWSPDEATVGFLATGAGSWRIAADTSSARLIPFDAVRGGLAQSIRKVYDVPAEEEDPLIWATKATAVTAFFKMHPEISLTYHTNKR